eukprot:Protomagalhaensia_wolfi_Nauph_80__5813@NODE_727_length_2064_cov_156_809383_g543_i0_p2_GENE_NODE_727_length_2064_cov_156_809383_g543_i0NODE_727_length_2064_cov_156_809383_g543_i0_p2_ORF_typecomplete_len138_score21_72dsDNA_bind/PF01984_20/6_2e18_NODE_727_length_2064_cov_156_809383_g543_i0145558
MSQYTPGSEINDPRFKDRLEAEQRRSEQQEQRRLTLKSILEQQAFERCELTLDLCAIDLFLTVKRLELVKPEKAHIIEEHLIQNGRKISGGAKITEEQLVSLLHQIEDGQQTRGPKVTINRRRVSSDSEDDQLWKGG